MINQCKLYIGCVSRNTIDATIEYSNEYNVSLGLIPSRRQIDYDGGYVGFTSQKLNEYVHSKTNNVILQRDHGGPSQGKMIDDGIEDLLNSYDTKLLPYVTPSDTYLINDDRALKYLLEIAIHDYLCPKKCIFEYGLSKTDFDNIIKDIKQNFVKALVIPGEMVGIVAAQSIGEPTSQLTLNTKHQAGKAKNTTVNSGLSRIEELLHFSKDIKTPVMTVYFDETIGGDKNKVNKISSYFKYLTIKELIDSLTGVHTPTMGLIPSLLKKKSKRYFK